MNKLTFAKLFCRASARLPLLGLCLMMAALLTGAARAQSVQIGDTTVAVRSLHTETGRLVASEWAALANHAKTRSLLTWATAELGCTPAPISQDGFTTTEMLRFTRTGSPVPTDQEVRQTIVPVRCVSPRYPKATAALLFNRYVSAPGLAYPRLLIRYGNNGYMVEEFSMRRDNKVTKMTCKFGDCVFRSGLGILEQRNGAVYRSLMNVFANSANEPVFNTLRRLYDAQMPPVGQGELLHYSGILISTNLEEEFTEGYISGTLDQSFKPERNDSFLVQQAKLFAKDVLNELRKKAAGALADALCKLLGCG